MKYKIAFRVTTSIMILWFGIGPIFAYDDADSLKVIAHLGYPSYFSPMLTCFKVLGTLALVVPQVPNRMKEWAYAGFAIDLTCAIIGFLVIDGLTNAELLLPATALAIVVINYVSFNKLRYAHAEIVPSKHSALRLFSIYC
jgi:hypothetical protein